MLDKRRLRPDLPSLKIASEEDCHMTSYLSLLVLAAR
jgi:hypothetical protein